MTAPTPDEIDAIRERHEKHRNEIWFTPETVDTLLAAIADRDDTIERLTKEAAIWDAQAGARHADVTALEAEVARLTAERDEAAAKLVRVVEMFRQEKKIWQRLRDEAAAKERERIVAWLENEAHECDRTREMTGPLPDETEDMCFYGAGAYRHAADAIARGEPQGENDA